MNKKLLFIVNILFLWLGTHNNHTKASTFDPGPLYDAPTKEDIQEDIQAKLLRAVRSGFTENVQVALNQGADINALGGDTWDSGALHTLPLFAAIKNRSYNPSMIDFLLKHKADPNKPDPETGKTPIEVAIERNDFNTLDIIEQLIASGAKPKTTPNYSPLVQIIKNEGLPNKDELLELLIANGVTLNPSDLDEPAIARHLPIRSLLAKDLMSAIENNNIKEVDHLIKNTNPKVLEFIGSEVLFYSAFIGTNMHDYKIVEYLLKNGLSKYAYGLSKPMYEQDIFSWAVNNDLPNLIKLILINSSPEDIFNALSIHGEQKYLRRIIQSGKTKALKIILPYCTPQIINEEDITAHRLYGTTHLEFAVYLYEDSVWAHENSVWAHENLEHQYHHQQNQRNYYEIIEMLLYSGAIIPPSLMSNPVIKKIEIKKENDRARGRVLVEGQERRELERIGELERDPKRGPLVQRAKDHPYVADFPTSVARNIAGFLGFEKSLDSYNQYLSSTPPPTAPAASSAQPTTTQSRMEDVD